MTEETTGKAPLEHAAVTFASGVIGALTALIFDDPASSTLAGTSDANALQYAPDVLRHFRSVAEYDAMKKLQAREEDVRANMEALHYEMHGEAPTAADVTTVIEMYVDAWTRASDRRVRELIENAAVNAFDPKRYVEGLTRTLFAILGRLEYGDFRTLRELSAGRHPDSRRARGPTMWAFHASRLLGEQLVHAQEADQSGLVVTELGKRVLDLVERDDPPSEGRHMETTISAE